MVQVDYDIMQEKHITIDLESLTNVVTSEEERSINIINFDNANDKNDLNVEKKKNKKKSSKKPPKPPRPPRPLSLDAADQKLIREISELAMLKRMRIERMRALKQIKNAKSTNANSSLFALVVTIIFCIVIIWQGIFSRGGSIASFQGSPISSAGARSGFISVQFYKNISTNHDSGSASPNNIVLVSGLDDRGGTSRGAE